MRSSVWELFVRLPVWQDTGLRYTLDFDDKDDDDEEEECLMVMSENSLCSLRYSFFLPH